MIIMLPLLLLMALICLAVAVLAVTVPAALLGWLVAAVSGRLATRTRMALVGVGAVGATVVAGLLVWGTDPELAAIAMVLAGGAAGGAGVLLVQRSVTRRARPVPAPWLYS